MLDNFLSAVLKKLENEPFWAHVSLYLAKVRNDFAPFVAGISFNKEREEFVVMYNTKKMKGLDDEQMFAIYKHELYHFLMEHLTTRLFKDEPHVKQNICMDLAINCQPDLMPVLKTVYFDGNKENTTFIPGFGQCKDIPPDKTFEWYMENIPKEFFDGYTPMDLMDFIEKMTDGKPADIAEQIKKSILKKAVDAANKSVKGWGTCPAPIRKMIEKSFETELSPEEVIRQFIVGSITFDRKNYLMRRSRRNANKIGKVKQRYGKFVICIDQSGSMCDELMAKIFGWAEKLAHLVSFDVVPFDDGVDLENVFTWKKGQKVSVERTRSGGTNFDPPSEFVNEKRYDGAIFISDLYGPLNVRTKCKRIWIAPKSSESAVSSISGIFGEKVLILDKG